MITTIYTQAAASACAAVTRRGPSRIDWDRLIAIAIGVTFLMAQVVRGLASYRMQ